MLICKPWLRMMFGPDHLRQRGYFLWVAIGKPMGEPVEGERLTFPFCFELTLDWPIRMWKYYKGHSRHPIKGWITRHWRIGLGLTGLPSGAIEVMGKPFWYRLSCGYNREWAWSWSGRFFQ